VFRPPHKTKKANREQNMSNLFKYLSLAMLIAASLTGFTAAQEVTGPSGAEVFVKVTQNREISGTPIDLTELKVTTSFGTVDIPMAKIDGIKMHADGNDSSRNSEVGDRMGNGPHQHFTDRANYL